MALDQNTIVGVVGAGAMGSGIAQVAAAAGHRVVLGDAVQGATQKAQANIARSTDRVVEKGRVSRDAADELMSRINYQWEPLADKQQPRNGYAAKFATPYLLATGFVRGGVGLGAFTEEAIRDSGVLALAAKVKYVIDPENPYPNNYTGHVRAAMKDGSSENGMAAWWLTFATCPRAGSTSDKWPFQRAGLSPVR